MNWIHENWEFIYLANVALCAALFVWAHVHKMNTYGRVVGHALLIGLLSLLWPFSYACVIVIMVKDLSFWSDKPFWVRGK